jgi:hypothetical protein
MNADAAIAELLLSGRAAAAAEAEEMFLDAHLADVLRLVASPLSEEEFRNHELIRLLFAHGSRPREDSLW